MRGVGFGFLISFLLFGISGVGLYYRGFYEDAAKVFARGLRADTHNADLV